MNATPTNDAVERLVQFFEKLQPQDLPRLAQMYAQDARFKDPFNEVQGLAAVQAIFAQMFRQLHEPRFVVTSCMAQGNEAFLAWSFHFRFRSHAPQVTQTILGATHVRLGPDGRVVWHRDYWDAAEELYEKLPVVGSLMRWLKRRANS